MTLVQTGQSDWLSVEALPESAPVAALLLQDLPGGDRLLIIASEAGGGLAGVRLDPEGAARFVNMRAYASSTPALSGVMLESVTLAGQPFALPLGAATGGLTGFAIGTDGRLAAARPLDPGGIFPAGRLQAAATLGEDRLATATTSTLTLHDLDAASGAVRTDQLQLASGEGRFTALAPVGETLLLAAVADTDEIRSYSVTPNGALRGVDAYGAGDGAGIFAPSALATGAVGTGVYAVLAAAGSDTLTVFRVSASGALIPTDHLIDSGATRFEGARQIKALSYGDWSLFLAAGSDGGASLFALLPGGRLFHLHSMIWGNAPGQPDSTRSLAALATEVAGARLDIFAAPEGARGLHLVALDLSGLGAIRQGAGVVSGTADADILIATGAGARMTGGAGADHFVFLPDHADAGGHLGTVLDFTPGEDWIDLSALPFFTAAAQASLHAEAGSTVISVGAYSVTLQGLRTGTLAPKDIIAPPLSHVPVARFEISEWTDPDPAPPPAVPRPDLKGGAGNDLLRGTGAAEWISGLGGNDTLEGAGGNDTLEGGPGDDVITGGDGSDIVLIAAASTAASVAYEAGVFTITSPDGTDRISGVELFRFTDVTLTISALQSLAGAGEAEGPAGLIRLGTPGDDTLRGTPRDDLLIGYAGADRLLGEGGNDTLDGGAGSDTLNGGDGDDVIFGGPSETDLRDIIFGGAGHDVIDAGAGNDLVYGQEGNDTISGGFGADELQGQEGNDVITGAAFSDLVYGGPGDDFVNGGFGYDRINGGSGADKFYHLGVFDHGSDWVQDYNAAEGDVLVFGNAAARADQFRVTFAHTANTAGERSGADDVQEAFVIYKPTGQIIWALVDGDGQSEITLQIGSDSFDLMA